MIKGYLIWTLGGQICNHLSPKSLTFYRNNSEKKNCGKFVRWHNINLSTKLNHKINEKWNKIWTCFLKFDDNIKHFSGSKILMINTLINQFFKLSTVKKKLVKLILLIMQWTDRNTLIVKWECQQKVDIINYTTELNCFFFIRFWVLYENYVTIKVISYKNVQKYQD